VGFTDDDALKIAASDAPLRVAIGTLRRGAVDPRISVAFAQAHVRRADVPETVEAAKLRTAAASNPSAYATVRLAEADALTVRCQARRPPRGTTY
jgi:hypothetical protein